MDSHLQHLKQLLHQDFNLKRTASQSKHSSSCPHPTCGRPSAGGPGWAEEPHTWDQVLLLPLITAMGTVCRRQMDRSHGKDGPSQTEQDGFLMDRSWGGSRSSCRGWQNQAASPGTQLKTALRSCEYRSGRAIRRNSNKLLPLQPSHLNTFHCAAVLEKGPPPTPPHHAAPALSAPAWGDLILRASQQR